MREEITRRSRRPQAVCSETGLFLFGIMGDVRAADPGNGIVAQALLSVSRRSARLFRPLGAASFSP